MNNDRIYHCKWSDSAIAWSQHRRWEFPLGCVCRLRHSHRHHRTICKYDIWQYTIFHNVQNLEGKGLDSPPSGFHFPVCCLQGLSCFVFWFLLHCCSGNLHNILTTDSMQGFLLERKTFKRKRNGDSILLHWYVSLHGVVPSLIKGKAVSSKTTPGWIGWHTLVSSVVLPDLHLSPQTSVSCQGWHVYGSRKVSNFSDFIYFIYNLCMKFLCCTPPPDFRNHFWDFLEPPLFWIWLDCFHRTTDN